MPSPGRTAPPGHARIDVRDIRGVDADEREVVVGACVGVGLVRGLHRQPRVVDERPGLRRARDLDRCADRQRRRRAAVRRRRAARTGAVSRLPDVRVSRDRVAEDEVRRALRTGREHLHARMNRPARRRRRGRCTRGRARGQYCTSSDDPSSHDTHLPLLTPDRLIVAVADRQSGSCLALGARSQRELEAAACRRRDAAGGLRRASCRAPAARAPARSRPRSSPRRRARARPRAGGGRGQPRRDPLRARVS